MENTNTFPLEPNDSANHTAAAMIAPEHIAQAGKNGPKFSVGTAAVYNGGGFSGADDPQAGTLVHILDANFDFGFPMYTVRFSDGTEDQVFEEDLNYAPGMTVQYSSSDSAPEQIRRNGTALVTGFHRDAFNELVHDLLFPDGFTCSAMTAQLRICSACSL